MTRRTTRLQGGFTLIELLMAMSVFAFMLLIVIAGFINVANIHSQAVASDSVQDNARVAMAELVRAVRDASSLAPVTGALPTGELVCINKSGGTMQSYRIISGVLTRSDSCGVGLVNPQAITNSTVDMAYFDVAQQTFSPVTTAKPEIQITLRVVSSGVGLTKNTGLNTACGDTSGQRAYCSAITLTSGAVPR
jgi:prepilin-type N-terminal cleavage/methylation domain-containing protein